MIQVQLKGTNVTGIVNNITLNRVTSVRSTVRGNGFNMINVRDGNGGRVIIRNSAFSSLNTMQSDGVIMSVRADKTNLLNSLSEIIIQNTTLRNT
jgi:hypothetical protein